MSDAKLADRIFNDELDILVDLAGHTNGNRLLVFAMKPAPIQVTYIIGYGYTTGLSEIDYLLGDDRLTPIDYDKYFSEKVWRIASPSICYSPPINSMPPVNDLPALKNGYVTFGCMSRSVRLNDNLLKTWGRILGRLPNSRLRLDQKIFSGESVRNIFYERMKKLGLPISRVDLLCSNPHWFGYHEIDISLDCFPHNAGTTTFDSLWMGVPVLSKIDRPSVGRFGHAILGSLGLEDWVAVDTTDYVDKAVFFASDFKRLMNLRKTLRFQLLESELSNAGSLAKNIENAYIEMINQKT
jgi:predicted O-linked N-acetylglucosamine transferase (SPINDLY family)